MLPLLKNNPYIDEAVPYNSDAFVHLLSRTFDHVVNLDAGKISAGMATMAKAKDKIGYILHEKGYVTGTNDAAHQWQLMGIFDDLKKINRRSYQEIMCSILGLPTRDMRYVLKLTAAEEEEGYGHLSRLGLDLDKRILGIHTGGGGRWTLKQWTEEKFTVLIYELVKELDQEIQILLFGGPLEQDQNRRIMGKVNGPVFDAGCNNEVRHFASLIKHCSVVLSGDSLAMHVALATNRRAVVLFGPTSSAEIELFGLGEKVVPDLDCLSCYKRECDFIPNCMDSISVDRVKQAVVRQLEVQHNCNLKNNPTFQIPNPKS